ncbi:MAG: DUF3987 domain-containing protein [Desulfovibrio sp.]|jgi:phage/plasmid primase-like uncharacterized protein|nr:DUF3987 domain-containing protein [Desulfovibrio sp.]
MSALLQDDIAAAHVALHNAGLLVDSIEFDGALHRCGTIDKPDGKNGVYIAHADPPVSIWWQNWRSGESGTWTAKGQDKLTSAEREDLARRMRGNRKAHEAEQTSLHAEATAKAKSIYDAAEDCTEHPYLEHKGVQPVPELKVSTDLKYNSLIVPVRDETGNLVSLQFISADENADPGKRFLAGGRKKSCFFPIGGKSPDKPLLICEGLATGLSLHECLELPVLVAFDAGNLLSVAETARRLYPERQIILAADYDDLSKEFPDPGGIGLAKASAAALAVNGFLAVPRLGGRKVDWNDLHRLMGAGEVRTQFMNCREPGPDAAKDENEAQKSRILPPPPPAPLKAFPASVAALLEEAAEAFTVPLQIPAACLLAFLACLVGRSRLISIKEGWREGGNLWIGSVANSGMGKSPCMDAFFRVITRLEYEAKRAFDDAYAAYETEVVLYQVQRTTHARDKAKGKDLGAFALSRPEEPKQRQATADDVTVEALGDILQGNPKGVLWLKDELAGMLFDLDKYTSNGGGGTKARLLSSHSLGPWKTNRTSNPARNNFIPKACVSIFGGIQPGMMSKVFEAGAGGVDEESGFLPRFLFIRAAAEAPAYWSERIFSLSSKELLQCIAAHLWPWDVEYDGEGLEIERIVPVSRQAKALYVGWYDSIAKEAYISQNSALLRKLQAHALRLCLLLHCLDAALAETDGMNLVTEDTMRRALLLADWVKGHQEQCWRFFAPQEKGVKQADPIERAIMQVVVEEATRIKAEGWRISNSDLSSLVEEKLSMPGLSKEKIGKAASRLGLTPCAVNKGDRGRTVTKEKINEFRTTVGTVGTVGKPCTCKGKTDDSSTSQPSATVGRYHPAWGAPTVADGTPTDGCSYETTEPQGIPTVQTVQTVHQGHNPEFDFNNPDFPDGVLL